MIWLTAGSVDLLSSTGRAQAFSLGETFYDHYGFSLLNKTHVYKIEYGGTFVGVSWLICTDQNRVEETARWFAMGFWGINSSDSVKFRGIPENICTRNSFVANSKRREPGAFTSQLVVRYSGLLAGKNRQRLIDS